jgi:hypothetical protein
MGDRPIYNYIECRAQKRWQTQPKKGQPGGSTASTPTAYVLHYLEAKEVHRAHRKGKILLDPGVQGDEDLPNFRQAHLVNLEAPGQNLRDQGRGQEEERQREGKRGKEAPQKATPPKEAPGLSFAAGSRIMLARGQDGESGGARSSRRGPSS